MVMMMHHHRRLVAGFLQRCSPSTRCVPPFLQHPSQYQAETVAASRREASSLTFATLDPDQISGSQPAEILNLVHGKWTGASKSIDIVDPLNGNPFLKVPDTNTSELKPFIESLRSCPKSGLHNPFRNPESFCSSLCI